MTAAALAEQGLQMLSVYLKVCRVGLLSGAAPGKEASVKSGELSYVSPSQPETIAMRS